MNSTFAALSVVPPPVGLSPKDFSQYGYVPTKWITLLFLVLFGIVTVVHLAEAIYFRIWWLLPTAVLAGVGECIGWSGRYWSSLNYGELQTPFLIQISTTIISPTPFLAAYFLLLGRLIPLLGEEYSRLKPKYYTTIFLTADVVALVIQAAGGGIASSAVDPTNGGHIMLAGIVFQLFFLIMYTALGTEFLIHYILRKPIRLAEGQETIELGGGRKDFDRTRDDTSATRANTLPRSLEIFIGGMCISIFCLFIRGIYRTAELSNGWNGVIITTEVYFNVFDGAMVLLALYSLAILHPGYLFLPFQKTILESRNRS